MENTLKIKLSKAAHHELIEMIKLDETHSSIRFVYASGCCKSAKVDIYLDNFKTGDVKTNVGDLIVLYDNSLLDNIVELTIAYTDSKFWIKTKFPKDSKPNCSESSNKSCNGCSGNCSSH